MSMLALLTAGFASVLQAVFIQSLQGNDENLALGKQTRFPANQCNCCYLHQNELV